MKKAATQRIAALFSIIRWDQKEAVTDPTTPAFERLRVVIGVKPSGAVYVVRRFLFVST
jgi:hypothetical protein